MSIKSDRWIKEKAAKEGMIEPFEPEQVRYKDGDKVISYGTSSMATMFAAPANLKSLQMYTLLV